MNGLAEATTGSSSVDTVIAWSVGLTAVLTLVVMIWRPIHKFGQRFENFFDDWAGTAARPGVPARPGMMQRVSDLESTVADIKHELHPNSGGSLRDVADRIEAAVAPPPAGS